MKTSDILKKLKDSKEPRNEVDIPIGPGVYAIFLREGKSLGEFKNLGGRIIYIGESKDLKERKHFSSDKTGFSTLRRSLGAILRKELKLVPIPRSKNSDPSMYKFLPDGEERLTEWMHNNLEIATVPILGDYKEIQNALIKLAEPTLNLTMWENPNKRRIQELRKACADLAQNRVG